MEGSWNTVEFSTLAGGKSEPLDGDFFIGSADWMYRNLQTRVEAATPIEKLEHRRILWTTLEYSLQDVRQSWELLPSGSYQRVRDDGVPAEDPRQLGIHQRLMNDALALHARSLGGTSSLSDPVSESSPQEPQLQSESRRRKQKNPRSA